MKSPLNIYQCIFHSNLGLMLCHRVINIIFEFVSLVIKFCHFDFQQVCGGGRKIKLNSHSRSGAEEDEKKYTMELPQDMFSISNMFFFCQRATTAIAFSSETKSIKKIMHMLEMKTKWTVVLLLCVCKVYLRVYSIIDGCRMPCAMKRENKNYPEAL